MSTLAHPSLVYACEIEFACTYAMRRPHLAAESAYLALCAAVAMRRPDLAYRANELLAAIGGAL